MERALTQPKNEPPELEGFGISMITFYLVRHGESEGNVLGVHPGDLPFHLTDLGKAQAEKTAKALSGIALDWVYASDHVRTQETADFIMRYQHCPLEYDRRLWDLIQGELRGLTKAQVRERFPEVAKAMEEDIYTATRPGGGESFNDLLARAWDFMEDIASRWKDREDARIGVVTHGGVINVIVRKIQGGPVLPIVRNCSISVVTWDKGKWAVLKNDDVSHLC